MNIPAACFFLLFAVGITVAGRPPRRVRDDRTPPASPPPATPTGVRSSGVRRDRQAPPPGARHGSRRP